MMSLMLKLLILLSLSSSVVFSADKVADNDKKVIGFLEKAIAANENYTVDKVVILKKEALKEAKEWEVFFVRIDLSLIKQEGKKVSINDIIFTNGKVLSKDFIDMSTGKSIKNSLSLDMDVKAYNKEHLLAGNFNAPNKIVIFSDPLCPFCMDFVPEVITDVQKHPETFALFYYHFPLTIHPSSPTLVKAMIVAEEKGDKDIVMKMYQEIIETNSADEKEVLALFNKTFNKSITLQEINQAHVIQTMENDKALANNLMVNGTPTVYLNGKKDENKKTYKKLIKESK